MFSPASTEACYQPLEAVPSPEGSTASDASTECHIGAPGQRAPIVSNKASAGGLHAKHLAVIEDVAAAEDAIAAGEGAIRLTNVLGDATGGTLVIAASAVASIQSAVVAQMPGVAIRLRLKTGEEHVATGVHCLSADSAAVRSQQRVRQCGREIEALKARLDEADRDNAAVVSKVESLEQKVAQKMMRLELRMSDLQDETRADVEHIERLQKAMVDANGRLSSGFGSSSLTPRPSATTPKQAQQQRERRYVDEERDQQSGRAASEREPLATSEEPEAEQPEVDLTPNEEPFTPSEKPLRQPGMSGAAATAARAVLGQLKAVNDFLAYAGNRAPPEAEAHESGRQGVPTNLKDRGVALGGNLGEERLERAQGATLAIGVAAWLAAVVLTVAAMSTRPVPPSRR